ncbi:unnamed protein product [Gongylonema pulchrum]|uniref:Transposase n=1 Tax=Gongylonema pulchrum TaxID=637853 RepID=A0A183EGS1_9BILA|nr:unnamed protein product [Gongylonema pulchrum]
MCYKSRPTDFWSFGENRVAHDRIHMAQDQIRKVCDNCRMICGLIQNDYGFNDDHRNRSITSFETNSAMHQSRSIQLTFFAATSS